MTKTGMPDSSALYDRLQMMRIRGGNIPSSPVIQSESSGGRARPGGLSFSTSGLDVRRPPPTLHIRDSSNIPPAPTNGTSSRNSSNLFDLENFTPELRIDGQSYSVSQVDFENLSYLGEGACGNVQLMKHTPTGVKMAVKRMRRTQDMREQMRIFTDLNIVIKQHQCPHIINSYGAYVTEQDVCICMEPMDTCLDKLQKKMREKKIVGGVPENVLGKITVGVVRGLDYLKRQYSVIHRDVKPSNILIDRHGQVKICDFGIAGNLVDSRVWTRDQGCPAYMSPERIDPPDQDSPSYDIRADVWSLGISLIELANCKYPYNNTAVQFSLMTEIINSPSPTLDPTLGFSDDFVDFVGICLIKDVSLRPKYERLLQHPFIKKYEAVDKSVIADWYTSNFLDQEN
ncbi:hypothetical protein ACHWQZ_G019330 [Mnemiopsis leidyi]